MDLKADFTKKRTAVQKLVDECPQSHNLINFTCPIRTVRKLTTENRARYIDNLSEGQIDNILVFHKDCYTLATRPVSAD